MAPESPDRALVSTAELWLSHCFDGIGNAGDVGGEKVRYYRGDSFTHEFHGYQTARTRLGRDYGEALADAPNGKRGLVGIVGEIPHPGAQRIVCEVFDLSSGRSVVVAQAFRKRFLKKKRLGPPQVVGDAEPLSYTATPPELKELIGRLKALTDERIAARHDAISAAGIDMRSHFSERGGDVVLWDYDLAPHRDNSLLEIWSKQIWVGSSALVSEDELADWLDQKLDIAIKL
jgi:hypothetical protein